jgi:hypothetical protein
MRTALCLRKLAQVETNLFSLFFNNSIQSSPYIAPNVNIVTCLVIRHGVWIVNRIYWTLPTRNYK